jgi:hypothetical protein
MITEEQLCKHLSQYNGEEVDSLKQVQKITFSGEELLEFFNSLPFEEEVLYEPSTQGTLTEGTMVYNFDTGEEDVIVDYKNGRSAITKKGRIFHCSTFALGGGWKAVTKRLIKN